jgi:hypothetical protein
MQVRRCQKDVDARSSGDVQRSRRALDVGGDRSGQACNHRPSDLVRDYADAGEVAVRGDGKPRLDDVDAERVQLTREAKLFAGRHAEARRLLAVTERRVEDADDCRSDRHDAGSVGHEAT